MVVKLLAIFTLAMVLVGCGSDAAATQKEAPLTIDQQIKNIEKRTDMPEDVKASTIAGMKKQQEAQQAAATKK